MDSKHVFKYNFYLICSDIYRFLAECTERGLKGGETWIPEDIFEVYKEAQKTCNITLVDLGETGEIYGRVGKIRKVFISDISL
jgi:hypothetical protein